MSSLKFAEAVVNSRLIESAHFEDEDLTDYQASNLAFHDCRFSHCNFDYSNFRSSRFVDCHFSSCSLKEAEFVDCSFLNVEKQTGTNWSSCNFAEAKFIKCNLSMNRITKSEGYLLSIIESAAVGIKLEIDSLRRVSKRLTMGGLRISKTKMQFASFAPGNYEKSELEQCDLRDCVFVGSNFDQVSFRGSSLNNAEFAGSSLDHANLSYASFDSIDLVSMRSFRSMVVSRDQHEAILMSIGILTAD